MSITALIKSSLLPLLGDVSADGGEAALTTGAEDRSIARVGMRMQRRHARLLAGRARACGLSQGQYLGTLLDDGPPPELPQDHGDMISALLQSSDQLAAMSVDINALLRLTGPEPSPHLQDFCAQLQSLAREVRAHLEWAAPVLNELRRFRRPQ